MPRDLYPRLGFPNDISWMILSGRNTGSQIHFDPDLMGAWNLLLTGRKWWVFCETILTSMKSIFTIHSPC